jgi:hypothetical protein
MNGESALWGIGAVSKVTGRMLMTTKEFWAEFSAGIFANDGLREPFYPGIGRLRQSGDQSAARKISTAITPAA